MAPGSCGILRSLGRAGCPGRQSASGPWKPTERVKDARSGQPGTASVCVLTVSRSTPLVAISCPQHAGRCGPVDASRAQAEPASADRKVQLILDNHPFGGTLDVRLARLPGCLVPDNSVKSSGTG